MQHAEQAALAAAPYATTTGPPALATGSDGTVYRASQQVYERNPLKGLSSFRALDTKVQKGEQDKPVDRSACLVFSTVAVDTTKHPKASTMIPTLVSLRNNTANVTRRKNDHVPHRKA